MGLSVKIQKASVAAYPADRAAFGSVFDKKWLNCSAACGKIKIGYGYFAEFKGDIFMEKLKDCQLQHVTPEEVGVKSSAVAAFINEINEKHLGLQSFTFVRHDQVFASAFGSPMARIHPMCFTP